MNFYRMIKVLDNSTGHLNGFATKVLKQKKVNDK